MREKRTQVDFSKHTHRVEIFKCGEKDIRVDHFQVGDSRCDYIQFVNTDEVLTVTGDYGNWIFCRPFVPKKGGYVSDSYWISKLKNSSIQQFDELDLEGIAEEIKTLISSGLEEYGYEGEELKKAKEWFTDLLEETDDKVSYIYNAFRDPFKPNFIDDEMIPYQKKVPVWLNIIFDAFDEICYRLENNEEYYLYKG